jgi:hypothetical protein
MSDSNKDLVVIPRWVVYSKTSRLTVGCNIRLRLRIKEKSCPCRESNPGRPARRYTDAAIPALITHGNRSKTIQTLLRFRFFLQYKVTTWRRCEWSFCNLRFDGYKQRKTGATHAQFGSQTDHKHNYNSCMEQVLKANRDEHDVGKRTFCYIAQT